MPTENYADISKALEATISALSISFVPNEVMDGVELGLDVVGSALPFLLARDGLALNALPTEAVTEKDGQEETEPPTKRRQILKPVIFSRRG